MFQYVFFGMLSNSERNGSEYGKGNEWKGSRVKTSICSIERLKVRCWLSISGLTKPLPIHQCTVKIRGGLNQSHFWNCWFNPKKCIPWYQEETSRWCQTFQSNLHQCKCILNGRPINTTKRRILWRWIPKSNCTLRIELLWQMQAHSNTTNTLGPIEVRFTILLRQHILDTSEDLWHHQKLDYTHAKQMFNTTTLF